MNLPFSSRLPASLSTNPITRELETLGSRAGLIDLTETNPTKVGLDYPENLLRPLGQAAGLSYRPDPKGLLSAREAVAAHYAQQGDPVPAERLILCASTSEAYSWLFKLLCNPGDGALAPRPGYPLFDGLADLEAIRLEFYQSHYDGLWSIDIPHLRSLITPSTRIILTVSPNNPTGALTRATDRLAIEELCSTLGLALVCDEVFAEYLLEPGGDQTMQDTNGRGGTRPSSGWGGSSAVADSPTDCPPCLTFRLGGLSKLAGLPQLKLAWIRVDGPEALVKNALDRLEFIADTFLSVGTPIQLALPELLTTSAVIRTRIQSRVAQNLECLKTLARKNPALDVLRMEGGWAGVVRVPTLRSEDELVLGLLRDQQVLAHPGYYFNFDHGSHLIVSLLPAPDVFAVGVDRINSYCR